MLRIRPPFLIMVGWYRPTSITVDVFITEWIGCAHGDDRPCDALAAGTRKSDSALVLLLRSVKARLPDISPMRYEWWMGEYGRPGWDGSVVWKMRFNCITSVLAVFLTTWRCIHEYQRRYQIIFSYLFLDNSNMHTIFFFCQVWNWKCLKMARVNRTQLPKNAVRLW